MATKEEIQALLDANASKRESLAAKIGPAQDAAQDAYNTWQFFKNSASNYSENWKGSLNGVTYTDPNLFLQAAENDFNEKRDKRKSLAEEFNALFPEKDQLEQQLKAATDATVTAKDTEGTTNKSKTEEESASKMANASVVGDTTPESYNQWAKDNGAFPAPTGSAGADAGNTSRNFAKDTLGIPAGAQPKKAEPAKIKITDSKGGSQKADLRVKIRVPDDYLVRLTRGFKDELYGLNGIIFPYTPSISYEHKAEYSSAQPLHSNFALYFYQRSSVSAISIAGKFTVQNEKDAGAYLATVHLLRALTKMRSGGLAGDADSGSPPPVCRLDAYGDYMLSNVPVVISSFRIELPDAVDYFTAGKLASNIYGKASVPTVSTIAISCIPMYSRQEMQKFSVSGWLSDSKIKKAGYL